MLGRSAELGYRVREQTPLVTRMPRTPKGMVCGLPLELPLDLLRDAARRLRVIALIYAGGFVIGESAGLLDPVTRADYGHFYGWGPPLISILVALLVAGVATSERLAPSTTMKIGLAFEVVGAYGIAFSTYWGVYSGLAYQPEHVATFGLSYVAPWIMFFTIVSPNEPRKALVAAILAGSSVPVVLWLTITYGVTSLELTTSFVANVMIVPWFLIVVTAYVGARVVYKLGTAVTKAREMGSYRLTTRLGGGGMGEVWRAEHQMLARPAAIKLIRPDKLGVSGESETVQRRFEREAQATALLRSAHTIDIYDFGVTTDGTFYYVMELMHGFDLEGLVNQFGIVPAERVVYILRQVCESLTEAHERSFIHRDIKPANIYLCREGRPVDCAKVLDFGLVKPRHEPESQAVKLTVEHAAGGTPAYMSPEQACGEAVDARTDIYSVGCVAYWMLTGELVFTGRTSMEVMSRHLSAKPILPSRRSELPIPEKLEDVILACLEKEPHRRPQTADALDMCLAAVDLDAPWTPKRAREWWERHQPTWEEYGRDSSRVLMV